jgi:hypothetical protein
MDPPIPAQAQDLREPLRIVLVVLVDPRRECCMDRPRVQTDDGMTSLTQAVHQPWRERAGLQAQGKVTIRHVVLERGGDHGGVGQALAAPHPPAFLVHTQMLTCRCEMSIPT